LNKHNGDDSPRSCFHIYGIYHNAGGAIEFTAERSTRSMFSSIVSQMLPPGDHLSGLWPPFILLQRWKY